MGEDKEAAGVSNVIRIDEERIKDHLGRIVLGTVEDTLDALLDAEADRLCGATRYERTEARRGATRGPAATGASCTPGPARSRSKCRSCGGRRSRR